MVSQSSFFFSNLLGTDFEYIDFDAINRVVGIKAIHYNRYYYCSLTPEIKCCLPSSDGELGPFFGSNVGQSKEKLDSQRQFLHLKKTTFWVWFSHFKRKLFLQFCAVFELRCCNFCSFFAVFCSFWIALLHFLQFCAAFEFCCGIFCRFSQIVFLTCWRFPPVFSARPVHRLGSAVEADAPVLGLEHGGHHVPGQRSGALGSIHQSRRKSRRQHGHPEFGRVRYANGTIPGHNRHPRHSLSQRISFERPRMGRIVALYIQRNHCHDLVGGVAADTDIHIGGAIFADCGPIRWPHTAHNAECAVVPVQHLGGGYIAGHYSR